MSDFLECETPNRPYLLGTHLITGEKILYRPDCKLWECPHCANVKAKVWASRVRLAVNLDKQAAWHFVTITIDEKTGILARQIEIFRSAWDKLSKRLRRAVGRDLTYALIPELSPVEFRLHAHMIADWHFDRDTSALRKRIDKRTGETKWFWYSKFLHDHLKPAGLGYIYDIQPMETVDQAASYCAKYIGKGLSERFPSGFRRVRTSQQFPEAPVSDAETLYEWEVIHVNSEGRRILLTEVFAGSAILDLQTRQIVDYKHPLIMREI
jgi:hypothetical protein